MLLGPAPVTRGVSPIGAGNESHESIHFPLRLASHGSQFASFAGRHPGAVTIRIRAGEIYNIRPDVGDSRGKRGGRLGGQGTGGESESDREERGEDARGEASR